MHHCVTQCLCGRRNAPDLTLHRNVKFTLSSCWHSVCLGFRQSKFIPSNLNVLSRVTVDWMNFNLFFRVATMELNLVSGKQNRLQNNYCMWWQTAPKSEIFGVAPTIVKYLLCILKRDKTFLSLYVSGTYWPLLYFINHVIEPYYDANLLVFVKGWATNCQQSFEFRISVETQQWKKNIFTMTLNTTQTLVVMLTWFWDDWRTSSAACQHHKRGPVHVRDLCRKKHTPGVYTCLGQCLIQWTSHNALETLPSCRSSTPACSRRLTHTRTHARMHAQRINPLEEIQGSPSLWCRNQGSHHDSQQPSQHCMTPLSLIGTCF